MASTTPISPSDPTSPSDPASPPDPVTFEGRDENLRRQPSLRPSRTVSDCHLCQDHERQNRTRQRSRQAQTKPPHPQPNEQSNQPQSSNPSSTSKQPHHRHTPSVDEKGYFLVYDPDTFEEPAKGVAGRFVKKLGVFAYALFFVIPLVFVSIFFAIIPLGEPTDPAIRSQWVFIFFSNSAVTLALAFLYNATFLSCAGAEKPFHISIIPLAAVFVVQIGFTCAVLLTAGVFDWFGLIVLSLVYITLFVSMYFAYKDLRKLVVSFFLRFMLLLVLFIPILTGFIISYRAANDSNAVQSLIAFLFTFVIFVYRRVMLSRLDPFPLEVSQLLSGFWVQHLGDSVTILAFPQLRSPRVFISLFVSNMLSNVFFLVFVSDPWIYKIRPTLKTYVLNGLKCNFPIPPIPEPDESFDPVNRGHDANVGGYRRRQFRFFFFRMLSQTVAMSTYLGISPILRFGLNERYTPLSIYKDDQYRNSMIYAGANLGFIALVAAFGYWFLNKRHHQTFHEIREIHRHDLVHHTWVGLMTTIITHNLIMTIAIILSHYCIFSAFLKCVLDIDDDFVNPER